MSGGPPEVTSPPEVPDEFAAAYREAYERALLDQTDAPRHRRPPQYRPGYVDPTTAPESAEAATRPVEPAPPSVEPVETTRSPSVETPSVTTRPAADVDLPERRGRLVVGTHRQEAVLEDTWFDHVRDSRLFVPALLAALALLLVLGAYVLGRAFTAAVGG